MISPSTQPSSLRPVWEDFTRSAKERCAACRHKLTSGKATYFADGDKMVPLGPVCASKYALPGSLRGLPDLTKGIIYEHEAPEEDHHPKAGLKKCRDEVTQRTRPTKEELEISAAIYYVILRGEKLPKMGFPNMKWEAVTHLYASYLTGSLDQAALTRVVSGMRTNTTNKPTMKFSLANLEACYAYARLLKKIKDEAKWLPREDYHAWVRLETMLRRNLFLDHRQRSVIEGLARRHLAKPPKKISVNFTAFRPEHSQNSLPIYSFPQQAL